MLINNLSIEQSIEKTAERLLSTLIKKYGTLNGKVISIAGESGSGKSVSAIALKKKLQQIGTQALIIHQDNYFKLPPKTNHLKRKKFG